MEEKGAGRVIEREFALRDGAVFRLSNVSGGIRVVPWDGETLRLRAEKSGKRAEEIEVAIEEGENRVVVKTHHPSERKFLFFSVTAGDSGRVDYTVQVPRIVFEELALASVSGGVDVEGVEGKRLSFETVSGGIRATRCAGVLRAKTVSGDVAASRGTHDELAAKSVSGDIDLHLETPRQKGWDCRIETVSGTGRVRLADGAGARCDFSTVSGSVRIEGPGGGPAGEVRRGSWRGTIGDGQGRIRASSVSGGLCLSGAE